ncbi:MAG: nitrilase-related carbon-nitrogen hydrolase [Candidatus Bipolaricaulota bacterium]|nr:nitrilase-related carbon-nitrogen hydrolase [Candidatus Bipolaricaulota bacterium]
MYVGIVQTEPIFGEVEKNLRHVQSLIGEKRSDLWVLPELFASGYQFTTKEEVAGLAEHVPDGPITQFLATIARRQHCHIVAGLAEHVDGQIYNTAVLVGPSGVLSIYHKIHLFFEEKRWFAPGERPPPVIDIGQARVGMMICFDHLFPEAARTLALNGADIIAHPANLVIPDYAQLTMRVRALENGVFTATANRIGTEARGDQSLHFTGESQIVSPRGEIIVRFSADGEEVRVIEIDPIQARDKSLNSYNDILSDRRPGLYMH